MKQHSRRAILLGGPAAAVALPWLGGCGGAAASDAEALDAAADLKVATAAGTTTDLAPRGTAIAQYSGASGQYRTNQRYLFQTIARPFEPARLPLGSDFRNEIYGPSAEYVDHWTGWPWERLGGDWLDANLTRWGGTPWFTMKTAAPTRETVTTYTADATRVVNHAQGNNRWCAFLIKVTGPARKITTPFHASLPKPVLDVIYQDGRSVKLACRLVGALTSGLPNTTSPVCNLPAFIEFERPTSPVRRARLSLTVTEHWGNIPATLQGFLLDPPINRSPMRVGLAASAGVLDERLASMPGVIGVHRYLDGKTIGDFAYPAPINTYAEREFDPALWGGPSDRSKLPHRGLGLWINTSPDPERCRLVDSTYNGDGFEPLAPGVGAMRFTMPAEPNLVDGSYVGYDGTVGGNASIFMPESLYGRLGRIFVRHYIRVGAPGNQPYVRDARRRLQVYHNPGQTSPVWTDLGGKFGVMPEHTTSYGGTSGSSGMGHGWQMRLSWTDSDAGTGGPDEGGIRPGFHLFDFGSRQPSGHNYSGDTGRKAIWGQQGGMGGVLYANRWYCVETEVKLNTVMQAAPGYVPDGELRAWVDGRLVFERKGMLFRALPLATYKADPAKIRPCRELGVRALWWNWFHGGVTANTFDRTMFITGLAWAQSYIGPMSRG